MQARTKQRWERLFPAGLLAVGALVTMVLVFNPSSTPVVAKGGESAELYRVVNGKRVILDHWSANTLGQRHLRLVSLKYDPAYGPSGGGFGTFGVVYHRTWNYGLGVAAATYDQEYAGWWYLTAVKPAGAAQYVTGCTGHGIVPPACGSMSKHTYVWNLSRDTHNVMWQWNFIGYVYVELNNKFTGPWLESWVDEMHMMGDGTMWWDAFRVY